MSQSLKYARIVLTITLIIAAIAAHLCRLGNIPDGFYIDESAIGYNAYCLAQTGADEYGVEWPLYFRCFGNYHDPVMVYSLVPAIAVFGLEKWVIRLPSALFHLLAAIAFGLVVHEHSRRRSWAIAGIILFASLPWTFCLSRTTMSGYMPMLLGINIGWWGLVRALRTRTHALACLAGLGWALAMYAHNIGRPTTALTLIAFVLAYHRNLWHRRRQFALFVVTYVAALLPMIAATLSQPTALTDRFNRIAVWHDNAPLLTIVTRVSQRYMDYFDPRFLFLHGDTNLRHHTGIGGELYWFLMPLILIGLTTLVRHWRRPAYRFLILAWLLYPAAAVLTIDRMHSTRCINGVPYWCLIAVMGAVAWWRRGGRRRASVFILALVGSIEASHYVVDYFTVYPQRARESFNAQFIDALEYTFAAMEDNDTLYISGSTFFHAIDQNFKPHAYAHLLFFGNVNPVHYQEHGLQTSSIQPYVAGRPVESGYLIRANARARRLPNHQVAIAANPEPIPTAAVFLQSWPYNNGIAIDVYRLNSTSADVP